MNPFHKCFYTQKTRIIKFVTVQITKFIRITNVKSTFVKLKARIYLHYKKAIRRIKRLPRNFGSLYFYPRHSANPKKSMQLQQKLTTMKNQVIELENKEKEMNKDTIYLSDLINKSNEALSNLNEKVFS
ncbi:hypothetical protein ACFTQ7_04205 [Lysinibacillus sp. NPDC056959]|uniref:hypothetical protein n=1 Tax=Lysinibacillus sp. NPDC056959 TaxID=3345981 RepID=UPI00363CF7D0